MGNSNDVAIVVTAYNRPKSLYKLLKSLGKLIKNRREDIDLIISIDNFGTEEVNEIAKNYKWSLGTKKVIIHETRLGLKKHFIWVGDQTQKYENIIFIEDDMIVSPYLLEVYEQLVGAYQNEPNVAGLSLYAPKLCEFDHQIFNPIQDGGSVFFLQHPYWGTVWFKKSWQKFKFWLENEYQYKPDLLPEAVVKWKDTSFKKTYIQFLIEKKLYFAYPRISVVTNVGVAGEHNKRDDYEFEVELQLGHPKLICPKFLEASAVYDAFFEINSDVIAKVLQVPSDELVVNLRGLKKSSDNYQLIRAKSKSLLTIKEFTARMKPKEAAIILGIDGQGVSLIKGEAPGEIFKKHFNEWICDNITEQYGEIEASVILGLIKKKIAFIINRIR